MSDQGFHEVQLSGKQLVFLFMSAVVLAVVVFLLGVNVGQGVRSSVGDTESTTAEAAVPETLVPADPAPGDKAEKTEKPAEPELSYHEMLVGSATPPPVAEVAPSKPVAEVAPPKPEATQTAAPLAAAPVAGAGDWFLQMGAYSTRGVADSQAEKLKQLSVPAFVLVPGAGSADKLFKVRVGPYKDRAEAEQVKIRLERQGTSSRITR